MADIYGTYGHPKVKLFDNGRSFDSQKNERIFQVQRHTEQ